MGFVKYFRVKWSQWDWGNIQAEFTEVPLVRNSSGAHAANDAHSYKGVKVEPRESQRHIRIVHIVTYVPVREQIEMNSGLYQPNVVKSAFWQVIKLKQATCTSSESSFSECCVCVKIGLVMTSSLWFMTHDMWIYPSLITHLWVLASNLKHFVRASASYRSDPEHFTTCSMTLQIGQDKLILHSSDMFLSNVNSANVMHV